MTLILLDPGITHDNNSLHFELALCGRRPGPPYRWPSSRTMQGRESRTPPDRPRFSAARSGGGIRRRARSHLKPLPAGRLLKRPCKISHNSTKEARGDYDFTPMPIVRNIRINN
ncbi:hypothetical protein IPC112_14925 [Pseudomonas aeruginosa]|nr:hypothetical protein IPC112_14925 [Pseudomonas aeruginosa]